jgi:hypothetical protein
MDFLLQKYGLPRSWLARALGLTPGGLDYAQKRGFREHAAQSIDKAIHGLGRLRARWRYTDQDTLAALFDFTPCSKSWLAAELGVTESFVRVLCTKRKARAEEARAMEQSFHAMGKDLLQFSLPYSMRRQAA